MSLKKFRIGIVGGTGMLGRTIATAILSKQIVAPADVWISNRSGRLDGFEAYPSLNVTDSNQELADACDVILLSVPPAMVADIAIRSVDRLVVSVMAGVSLEELETITGARRVVRAMSSPAAEIGLAYSPWCANTGVTATDRRRVMAIFDACGLSDEVDDELQIECFTALTGPVPGFVAYFAEVVADYAVAQGISPEIADRAVRQLFLAGGKLMSAGAATPADHVNQMIEYAGTTAAGLETMKRSSIAREIAKGLDASVMKTRNIRNDH